MKSKANKPYRGKMPRNPSGMGRMSKPSKAPVRMQKGGPVGDGKPMPMARPAPRPMAPMGPRRMKKGGCVK